jgi:pseudouridine-5'-phosphate glycosidase
MPYPKNLQTAMEVEAVVRDNGAVPATIAILDGVPHIGQFSVIPPSLHYFHGGVIL